MPRTRPPYSPEFRRQMVDLVRAGRNPDELAREFEPSGHSIRAWVAQADRNEGRREEAAPGLTAFERDELTRLRRENKQLRLERDILSANAANKRWHWDRSQSGDRSESRINHNPPGREQVLPHGCWNLNTLCAEDRHVDMRRTRPGHRSSACSSPRPRSFVKVRPASPPNSGRWSNCRRRRTRSSSPTKSTISGPATRHCS